MIDATSDHSSMHSSIPDHSEAIAESRRKTMDRLALRGSLDHDAAGAQLKRMRTELMALANTIDAKILQQSQKALKEVERLRLIIEEKLARDVSQAEWDSGRLWNVYRGR